MAPLRYFKCRRQDKSYGREDKQLTDRIDRDASLSVKGREHQNRGRGEYTYGEERLEGVDCSVLLRLDDGGKHTLLDAR